MKKLTLSADEATVRQAKRLAARHKTSVSRMFARLVRGMTRRAKAKEGVPDDSIASRATGFITLPKGKTPRDVLAEALMEKHGVKR
jgi:protoporphyrinogen oxidase